MINMIKNVQNLKLILILLTQGQVGQAVVGRVAREGVISVTVDVVSVSVLVVVVSVVVVDVDCSVLVSIVSSVDDAEVANTN